MLYRLRRAFGYALFRRLVAPVARTPPLAITDSPVRILTQLQPRDLWLYLVAAKTFYPRLGHGRFVLLLDPDLPPAARALLQHHLGGAVEFRRVEEVDTGRCQRGGVWERLITCLELARDHYVIQLDADTLSLGPLPEVAAAVAAGRPFVLGEGEPVTSALEAARAVNLRSDENAHIVERAQRALAELPGAERLRYVRASAGFAGFPRGCGTPGRELVAWFHEEMMRRLGTHFRAWGSEQVASNFLLANLPDLLVLPWPDYATVTPAIAPENLRFAHFIGTWRFRRLAYPRLARRALRSLQPAGRGGRAAVVALPL